jgi:hypothetical protein
LTAELSNAVLSTLQHDDVHETNVLFNPGQLDRPYAAAAISQLFTVSREQAGWSAVF